MHTGSADIDGVRECKRVRACSKPGTPIKLVVERAACWRWRRQPWCARLLEPEGAWTYRLNRHRARSRARRRNRQNHQSCFARRVRRCKQKVCTTPGTHVSEPKMPVLAPAPTDPVQLCGGGARVPRGVEAITLALGRFGAQTFLSPCRTAPSPRSSIHTRAHIRQPNLPRHIPPFTPPRKPLQRSTN